MRLPVVPSRSRARASTSRTSFTVAETAESSSNAAPVDGGDDARERRLAGARRPVEDRRADAVLGDRASAAPSPRRARAPGRRTRRACAAAAAARAARPRPHARDAASEKRSAMPQVCSARGRDQPPRRGDRPPQPAHPDRHDEPAGERDRGGRAAARLPRGERGRVRALRPRARAREPRRAHPRHAATARRCSSSGHTDVVLADAGEWSVPPFSGEVRDGEVWGRGALDMKGQVAANAVAIASLAREGFEPAGDLIFAATADEEVGDDFGLSWLCEAHPDAVRCDYAINEGARRPARARRQRRTTSAATAEKMTAPFRIRVHGRVGARVDARHRRQRARARRRR